MSLIPKVRFMPGLAVQEKDEQASQPAAQVPEVALYNELLFAVERKFPNETRHQTALRYIRSAEHSQTCVRTMLAAVPEVKP